jgi:hypothetical protein
MWRKEQVKDMSENQSQRPRRDVLDHLRREDKFSDCVILAWGIVEFELNNIILREYNVNSSDPKAETLLNLRFIDKLNLQKKLGFLNQEKYDIVQKFNQWRNRLFHAWSRNWKKQPSLALIIPALSPSERRFIMETAIRATDVVYELFDQVFSS